MTTAEVEEVLQQIHDLEVEIAQAEEKREASIKFHQDKIELAKRICEIDTNEPKAEIIRLQCGLESYYKANPPKHGKSIKFSGGTIGFRKQNPRYFFNGVEITNDNSALVDFIKKFYKQYLKTKEYVDWAKMRNHLIADDAGVYFKETGEILDGFSAQILPDEFKVKTTVKI